MNTEQSIDAMRTDDWSTLRTILKDMERRITELEEKNG